jgi:hypothetical protein
MRPLILVAAVALVAVGCADDLDGNLPAEPAPLVETTPCMEQWQAICAAGLACAPAFDAMDADGVAVVDGLDELRCAEHAAAVCAEVDGDPGCDAGQAQCFPESGLLLLPAECAPIIE